MGFLANLFKGGGAGEVVKNTAEGVGTLAKDLRSAITGELPVEKRAELEQLAQELEARAAEAQNAVNLEEAKSSKLFVAGWRPFIGWICGLALAFNFIVKPLLDVILTAAKSDVALPVLEISALYPIIIGMLGLSLTRTYEKKNNVQANH